MIERKQLKQTAKKQLKIKYWRNVLIGFIVTLTALGVLNSTLLRFFGNDASSFSIYDFFKSIIKYTTGVDFLAVAEDAPQYQQILFPILNFILATIVLFFTRNYTFPAYIAYTIVGRNFENVSGNVFPAEAVFYIVVAFAVYLLLTFLVLKPIHLGGARYFLKKAKGQETTGSEELFYAFHRYYNNIVYIEFIESLYLTLWSFTIIGGIIKHYQYFFVEEILAENPTLKPNQAIQLSEKITKGHLWDIFVFEISFFGYAFLNVLTGSLLGFFFYHPYSYLSTMNLYLALKEEAIDKDMSIERLLGYIDDESRLGLIPRTGKMEEIHYSLSDLILIFFTVAFGGWVWEVSLHFVQTLSFTNRGSLWGPWIPIYGFGAVTALFFMRKSKKYPWLVFLLSLVICTGIEYITGWICDLAGRPLWNYYGLPLALPYHHNPAYICFYGAMAFGFACTFAVYYAGPYFYTLYHNTPSKPKWIICSLLIAGILADCCVTIFYKKNPGGIDESGLEKISSLLRFGNE